MSVSVNAAPRRCAGKSAASSTPALSLSHLFDVAAEVGGADRAWPRTRGKVHAAAPRWSPTRLAGWLLEHARDERDERLYLRVVQGGVVDAALAVTWAPTPWSPPPRGGWVSAGTTRELLGELDDAGAIAGLGRALAAAGGPAAAASRAS